jgi:hypothetical protein
MQQKLEGLPLANLVRATPQRKEPGDVSKTRIKTRPHQPMVFVLTYTPKIKIIALKKN